jgi:hypothetical protein
MGVDMLSGGSKGAPHHVRRAFRPALKAAATVVAPLLILAGCVVQPGSGLTALQAQRELHSVLDETQSLVGGAWDERDDPDARGCVIPVGVLGETYGALRLAPPPEHPEVTAESVARDWLRRGYTVERLELGPVSQVLGTSPVGEVLIFRASELAMTLQAESECRPA